MPKACFQPDGGRDAPTLGPGAILASALCHWGKRLAAALAVAATVAPGAGLASGSACTGRAAQQTGKFHAAAVVTGDADWKQEWAKGAHAAPPAFTPAAEMAPGDKARLLVFFSNPLTDMGGAHVDCAIRVTRPGGQVSGLPAQRCFDTKLSGEASDFYMTRLGADIAVDDKYPVGTWQVDVVLTDVLAQRTVPLHFCYHVADKPGGQG
ncbi:hypothetical protein [Acidimangrovimonas pyrenivorans]|uniref:Uncharacterized protein n=1 Tax=Acidimangrovimonas pyrenivorans TaxID=2030798 RepID=A0ABV7AI21_9RHOB